MHKESVDALYAKFGHGIRRRRQELGLLQAETARRIGLSRASLSNIEAGRQHLQLHQIYDLARVLETDVNSLLPTDDVDRDASRHESLRALVIAAAGKA